MKHGHSVPASMGRCRTSSMLLALALVSPLFTTVSMAAPPDGGISPVIWFQDPGHTQGEVVPGATTSLVRTDDGVTATVNTSMLQKRAAYTVWFVVFNNPAACAMPHACAGPDLANDAVGGSVLFVTGHVLGRGRIGNFAGHIEVGDTGGCQPELPCRDGLTNPRGSEVHLVVRTHGEPIPGQVHDQISSFAGGCDVNACFDAQASIHAAMH